MVEFFLGEENIDYLNFFLWDRSVLIEIYPKMTFFEISSIFFWTVPTFIFLTNLCFWEIGSDGKIFSIPKLPIPTVFKLLIIPTGPNE